MAPGGTVVTASCRLVRADVDYTTLVPEIPPEIAGRFQLGHHIDRSGKVLTVILSIDEYSLEEAFRENLGIRRWLHVSVGVQGQWQARMADQRKIGRQRGPGERSPVPLPDWYDLTHIAYEHPELGFDRTQAVYQVLPPPGDPHYVNFAEVLHLRQPL